MSQPAPADLAGLASAATSLSGASTAVSESIANQAARRELDDRTRITGVVTTVFFISVPFALLSLLLLALISSASAGAAIAAVTDILKSVLLPIMTLVLGYYFGRGRS